MFTNLLLAIPDFTDPGIWISLLTLTFLEIVLGVDNIIFISIISNKLPQKMQARARNIGLLLAMAFRTGLLLTISWIISLTEPVFTLPFSPEEGKDVLDLSWKDLILIAGGLFLIVKSTLEIHHKLQREEDEKAGVKSVPGSIIAVVISIAIMMMFAGPVTRIINKHPTLQMLALTFLVVIGVVLIANGIHQEISKSIIYSCLAFSLAVEGLNIKLRKKTNYVELKDSKLEEEM